MKDQGLRNVTTWFWYKSGQNQANTQTVSAVETITVGSHCVSAGRFLWETSHEKWLNPLNRHNFIELPTVTTRQRNAAGHVLNQHENPPALFREFIDRFGSQRCTILIIGGGVGGDVLGALSQVGATVIALIWSLTPISMLTF